MADNETCRKKFKSRMNLKSLRLSLKYRPQLLKLILKMRQCIRKRNSLLKSLKNRLKTLESESERLKDTNSARRVTEKDERSIKSSLSDTQGLTRNKTKKKLKNKSTQTDNGIKNQEKKLDDAPKEDAGWNLKENGETEKSIAEQVKEAAQSVLQDSGMVYVESAGMYYDYKTGYYYNSELGLYYHSDTGCYYYYSDDKQFVFHSYPDMSKVNTSLIAHQKKQARKLKRERKPEDDIDNLTKHLSQDKEEDCSTPKKSRKSKKPKKEKKEKKDEKREKKVKDIKIKKKEEQKVKKIESKKQGEEEKKAKEGVLEENAPKLEDISLKNENVDVSSETTNQDGSVDEKKHEKVMDILETNEETNTANMTSDKNEDKTKNDKDPIQLTDSIDIINNDQNDSTVKETETIESKLEIENKDSSNEKSKEDITEELEDGECSETESEDSGSESEASTSTVSDEDSIAKHHPPCMRVIVRETKLPKLKVGSLFLITKDGGTVGREGEQHAILLKDHNVSRNHLDIKYDTARMTYLATDLGSKNGSILNGVRMSESQEVSLPLDVLHGSTIQLGETKLLCHVHPGNTTCGQCEPGLLMQVEEEKKAAYTRTVSVKKQHKLELARLKNIYAPQRLAIEEKPYNDRAQARRETVGSTNHAEKTVASDLDTSIAPDNKGFKLLQKMGWSKGEGLGKDSQGDTEPVPLTSNEGKAGLGTTGAVAPPSNKPKRVIKNNLASATMRLAARTKMLQPPAKAFQNEDDDEEN